jgi:hypothetical protein
VELARPIDDRAERLLAAPSSRFVITVPSRDVRRFLESERERRAVDPRHPREREDAPPGVLRDLWRELSEVAARLGIGEPGREYDPDVYRRVYETVLRHRNVDVVRLDVILPTQDLSVYDFAIAAPDLVPTGAEAEAAVARVARGVADPAVAGRQIERWWDV